MSRSLAVRVPFDPEPVRVAIARLRGAQELAEALCEEVDAPEMRAVLLGGVVIAKRAVDAALSVSPRGDMS